MTAKGKTGVRALLAATTLAILGGSTLAQGGELPRRECSVQMLRGLYLFKGSGFNPVNANGIAVPKAIIEPIRFNGDGTLVAESATVVVLGNAPSRSVGTPGTYTVNSDCTGTIVFSSGPAFDTYVSSPLLVSLIQTGPVPAVLQGDARFISR
jgi:hypothetical protein